MTDNKILIKEKNSKFLKIFDIPEIGILIPILILFIIFTSVDPFFISPKNLSILGKSMAYSGIIALGMAYSLIAGQIDLSVGSVAGMITMITGSLIVKMGIPVLPGILLGLIAACLVGLFNGVVAIKLKIPAIIVTLGMLFAAKGATLLICNGENIYPLPEKLVNFGKATPLGLSWVFIIFVILTIIFDFILRKTIYGKMVYATGANLLVARINGINTDRIKIMTHILTSFLAGMSGIFFMINVGAATFVTGLNWELPIIGGTIIGGVSLLGGFGTVTGAFLGIGLIFVISNGFISFDISPEMQNIVIGTLMIFAAAFDIWRRTKKR
jgi:ribose transport system permease protein